MMAGPDGTGRIVVLNGISAAGKSTLARGLQDAWPEPFLHVGLDAIMATMPARFLVHGPQADLGARWVTDEHGRLLRVDAGPFGERLLRGLPRWAAALADAGNHVVVDDVMLYPWRVADVATVMAGRDAHFVEVRCGIETARARARARGSASGMIDAYYDATYAHDDYDLRIDSGRLDPEACVEALVAHLRRGTQPTAFDRIARSAAGRVTPGSRSGLA